LSFDITDYGITPYIIPSDIDSACSFVIIRKHPGKPGNLGRCGWSCCLQYSVRLWKWHLF